MAETLGSLIDKLSIKNLRLWHLDEILAEKTGPETDELKAKKELIVRQASELVDEINGFLALAVEGKIKIRDQKLKLYKNLNVGSVENLDGIGSAISELAQRNIQLWHLEDEVRRQDIPDSRVAECKRRIDSVNQERNDLIDKIDEILETKAGKRPAG
ncbi:MAG: DUF4254 domain-containing protein [Nitrospinales bacterium]